MAPLLHRAAIISIIYKALYMSTYFSMWTCIYILIFPIVCLCALTVYPARADCAAATDISGVSGRWQLSR